MKVDLKDIVKQKTNKKKIEIRPLAEVDNFEKELSNFLKYMSDTMGKRFKSKVLDQMNKSTIEKFQDAQIGNYAVIYNRLVKDFEKSIKKQFSDKRVKKYIEALYKRVNKSNETNMYKDISNDIGVNVKDLIKTDGLNSFINAKQLETRLQIGKTRTEQMENLSTNLLRLMSAGQRLDTLYEEVENVTGKNRNKSELVARNELKTFNAQLNKKRADNLGIKTRVWNAIGGKRTRDCHEARDKKEYPVDGKLYSSCDGKWLEVGEEVNCRCYDTFVIDLDE